MKTVITIEDGKVTVQVDDGTPTVVQDQASPAEQLHDALSKAHELLFNPNTWQTPEDEAPLSSPDKVTHETQQITPNIVSVQDDAETGGTFPRFPDMRPKNLPEAPRPSNPEAITLPPDTRTCIVCGDDISHRHRRAKICEKESCKKKQLSEYEKLYNAKKQLNVPTGRKKPYHLPKEEPNKPFPTTREPWCTKCKAFTDHETADHPADMEVVEYTAEPKAFVPKNERVAPPIVENGVFLDPYDCQLCRNDGQLCNFHRKMYAGKQYPRLGKGLPS